MAYRTRGTLWMTVPPMAHPLTRGTLWVDVPYMAHPLTRGTLDGCSICGTSHPWYSGCLLSTTHLIIAGVLLWRILPVIHWMSFTYGTSYPLYIVSGCSIYGTSYTGLSTLRMTVLSMTHFTRGTLNGCSIYDTSYLGYTADDCSIYDTFYQWYTECLFHLWHGTSYLGYTVDDSFPSMAHLTGVHCGSLLHLWHTSPGYTVGDCFIYATSSLGYTVGGSDPSMARPSWLHCC